MANPQSQNPPAAEQQIKLNQPPLAPPGVMPLSAPVEHKQTAWPPPMAIATDLLAAESLEQVWALLVEHLSPNLGFEQIAIFYPQANDQGGDAFLFAHRLRPSHLDQLRHMFERSFLAADQNQGPKGPATLLSEIPAAKLDAAQKEALAAEGISHAAAFPLPNPGRATGMMIICRRGKQPFSAEDISLGGNISMVTAAVIARLLAAESLQTRIDQATRLNEITAFVHSTDSIPDILSNVVSMAAKLVGADAGLLGLLIGEDLMSFYPYNLPRQVTLRPLHKNNSQPWQIVENMAPIINNQFSADGYADQNWIEAEVQAYLGVPILGREECFGAINLFYLNERDAFSAEDCRLLSTIGEQAGYAIQNLRWQADAAQRTAVLSNALERLETRDQLKNSFIHSVSHELRSPLSIIYGHAELLDSGDLGAMNDAQRQSTQIILRRVSMLTTLVDDLSALLAAETQEFRREEINPIILFYSLLADYRMQAEARDLQLEADIADELPPILGDPNHLRRVFDNLLSNAFKYTSPGGQVKIKAWADANQLHIEVSDTGEGIPTAHLPRIFERFYQVTDSNKPRRKGTGLGLSLVKEIIEAHRGTISVQSKEGLGTAFTIGLPIL